MSSALTFSTGCHLPTASVSSFLGYPSAGTRKGKRDGYAGWDHGAAECHRPVVGEVGRIARADRGLFRPFGGQGAGKALLCGLARQGGAQERLATGRGHG